MSVDPGTIEREDWDDLLWFIESKKCTPFIGAGACDPYLPLGVDLANSWADKFRYPLKDSYDLAKVSQFMAIARFDMFPKYQIAEEFQQRIKDKPIDYNEYEPHFVLAGLPLPIYITTNYDSFMLNALKNHNKFPQRELCRWSDGVNKMLKIKKVKPILDSIYEGSGERYEPSPERPLVYHLHGYLEIPESMVLTESDYLDFMVRLHDIENPLLPPEITEALTTNALLFVGYSLADWNFRVLFRSLFTSLSSLTNLIIAVQLPPKDVKDKSNAIIYLGKYFQRILTNPANIKLRVYWGDAHQFMNELLNHWKESKGVK